MGVVREIPGIQERSSLASFFKRQHLPRHPHPSAPLTPSPQGGRQDALRRHRTCFRIRSLTGKQGAWSCLGNMGVDGSPHALPIACPYSPFSQSAATKVFQGPDVWLITNGRTARPPPGIAIPQRTPGLQPVFP